MRLTTPWVFALGFSLTAGCASTPKTEDTYRPPGITDQRVTRFRIQGIENIDEAELREGLATQVDLGWRTQGPFSGIPLVGAEPQFFNEIEWRRDQDRILAFYRARGYYNAKIVRKRVSKTPDKTGRIIDIKINEGEPVRVTSFTTHGLEALPRARKGLLQTLPLRPGDLFDQIAYNKTKAVLQRRMRQRGYAHARVSGRAIVRPRSRSADLTLYLDPGPKTRIGPISIQGSNKVGAYVRDALTFKTGDPYSAQALQNSQEAIYDLGVFSLVSVKPNFEASRPPQQDPIVNAEAETPTGSEAGPLGISRLVDAAIKDARSRLDLDIDVPIVVQLKPAKPLSVRLGAGISIDSTRQDVHVAANVISRNQIGNLSQVEFFNTFGYAWTPGLLLVFDEDQDQTLGNNGVIFSSELRYQQPQFLEQRTLGFSTFKLQRDIQERFISLLPSGSVGVRRTFFENLLLETSYNLAFTFYESVEEDYRQGLIRQGLAENPNGNLSFLLGYLELRATYDVRDNPLNPSKGWRVQSSLQYALLPIISEFSYLKPRVSVDGYLPYEFGLPMVTALRAHLSTIYNTNPAGGSGIPLASRITSGGRSSMRSFGTNYFGFFTEDTTNPGPIGSITEFDLSLEQRARVWRDFLSVGDIWVAGFFDAGSFFEEQLVINSPNNPAGTIGPDALFSSLIYGAGAGVWWVTPVGPIRIDVAWTLNDLNSDARYLDATGRTRTEVVTRLSDNFLFGIDNFFFGVGHSF